MPTTTGSVALRAFLDSSARPTGTLRYHELQGFLFAVASAPELIPPSEWMPIIFSGEDAGFTSLDETKLVISEIMALYNTVNAAVLEEAPGLPGDCSFREDICTNFDDDAPVSQWACGFLHGHQWLEELWETTLPEALEGEFAATVMTLTFFASREMGEAFWTEAGQPEHSFASMAETIREVFPDALAEYAYLGRSIYTVLAEHEQGDHEPRRAVRIGRNDRCPCGSGQKYKRCCGATVH